MRMKKYNLLLLGLIAITGCHSAKPKEAPTWKLAEQARLDEVIRQNKAQHEAETKFSEAYKRYECSRDDVPEMEESKGPGDRFKSMQMGDHLVLKLRLGKAVHLDGSPSGPTRTQSRYQLLWDGKKAAEAESLFSFQAFGGSNRFFYNPKDHTLAIYDNLCWSTQRFLVFERSAGTDQAPAWTTKYFYVPDTPSAQPFPDMGDILGVGNGRIYMQINGRLYAFPFDDFSVNKLEFTVG